MAETNVPRSKAVGAFARAQLFWTLGILSIGISAGYRIGRPDSAYVVLDILSYGIVVVGVVLAVSSARRAGAIMRAYPDLVEGTRVGHASEVAQWGCWAVVVLVGSVFLAYFLSGLLVPPSNEQLQ
jgi:hypothetical protein